MDVVAKEEPPTQVLVLWVAGDDLPVAVNLGLGSGIGGVKVVGDERRHVRLFRVCVGKEELLGRDRARRVDDDLLAVLDGLVEEGVNIGEEGSYNVTRLVALQPEVSLEGLEVGDLDVAFHEIADVGLEVGARGAILFGKGIAVLCKLGAIPLLIEDLGESFEGVWELAPALGQSGC